MIKIIIMVVKIQDTDKAKRTNFMKCTNRKNQNNTIYKKEFKISKFTNRKKSINRGESGSYRR